MQTNYWNRFINRALWGMLNENTYGKRLQQRINQQYTTTTRTKRQSMGMVSGTDSPTSCTTRWVRTDEDWSLIKTVGGSWGVWKYSVECTNDHNLGECKLADELELRVPFWQSENCPSPRATYYEIHMTEILTIIALALSVVITVAILDDNGGFGSK